MNQDIMKAARPVCSIEKDRRIDKTPGEWIANQIDDQPGETGLLCQMKIDTCSHSIDRGIQTKRGGF